MPGLFFDPEDGGNMFLRNIGSLSVDHKASYPRRQNSFYGVYIISQSINKNQHRPEFIVSHSISVLLGFLGSS
jgi:hypothetical protein